jgi:hypothetical protein
MEQNLTNTALIEDCTFYFEQNCYTKNRVERYRSMWRNGICRDMKDNGIKNCNRPVREDRDNISSKVTLGKERPFAGMAERARQITT